MWGCDASEAVAALNEVIICISLTSKIIAFFSQPRNFLVYYNTCSLIFQCCLLFFRISMRMFFFTTRTWRSQYHFTERYVLRTILTEPTVGGRSVRTARVEVLVMFFGWIIHIGNPVGSIRLACFGGFSIVVLVSKKICGKDSLQW